MKTLSTLLLCYLTATAYKFATKADGSEIVSLARRIDTRATPLPVDERSIAQDENTCYGIRGDYWVMSRDMAVDNVHQFCAQNASVMRYNQDTVNELELEVKNWNSESNKQSPNEAPDCIDRFKNAVIDGCDGNDMLNNPYNYKFGAILRTTDGWQYKMTPWSKQINDVKCDASYKTGHNYIEIRGKNFPSAQMGANGEGLRDKLSECTPMWNFHFEQTPDNSKFQWYASCNVDFFLKKCVGGAIQSAGGSSNGGCKRDASGIDDWPGYDDSYRHVFKHDKSPAEDQIGR
jgi:hypothetical protein